MSKNRSEELERIEPDEKVTTATEPAPAPEAVLPKSMRNLQALANQIETLELTPAEIRESAGGKKSVFSENVKRQKALLQQEINKAAVRFQQAHKPATSNPITADATQLLWIRAMVTHHPPPTVGQFSFGDVYNNYKEGMKYLVPKYVALALEEGENAIQLS